MAKSGLVKRFWLGAAAPRAFAGCGSVAPC